jgi:hypothetical protein
MRAEKIARKLRTFVNQLRMPFGEVMEIDKIIIPNTVRKKGALQILRAEWSFYRNNIEEEFTVKSISSSPPAGMNPLDELLVSK